MAQSPGIERFFLYGEPPRPAAARFVHLEKLDERSRPANWTIRPHAHPDLHHVFLFESGGGRGECDGGEVHFAGPCVVIAPAGSVHGFEMVADTAGLVLTFADSFLRELAGEEGALPALFAQGMWTASAEGAVLPETFARLEGELGWAAAGHSLAIAAHLSMILVEVLRLNQHRRAESHAPPGAQAVLVARYRALIEARFRDHPSVEIAAGELGVAPSRLRAACRVAAGLSPSQLLQDRLRLEAERLMRYSNMSVAQIALYLGFSDPAYFSRFFARENGASPRAFRLGARTGAEQA
jgi:AraC family transcriptional activator of pobA